MNKPILCKCGGMNEECQYCGGSGYIQSEKVEIIKAISDDKRVIKEKEELENYLHKKNEKFFISDKAGIRKNRQASKSTKNKKNDITLSQIDEDNPLKYIGPNNPNRKKLGDTRKFGKKRKRNNKSQNKKKRK